MSDAQRSRPEGNRTATNISAGDESILSDGADNHQPKSFLASVRGLDNELHPTPTKAPWSVQMVRDKYNADGTERTIPEVRKVAHLTTGSNTTATESYADMPPDRRELVDRYVAATVDGITTDLHASATWPEHHADIQGRGWEKLQADAANRLCRLARADWNGFTQDDAWTAFTSAAPTGGRWTAKDVSNKFTSQASRREPLPMPVLNGKAEAPEVTTLEGQTKEQAETRDLFALAVQMKVRDLEISDAAQRIIRKQRAGTQERPAAVSLTAFLSVPDEPARYRVDKLWPIGGRGILAAQYKAGKSTTVGNVLRSLVDGTPFLGTYEVQQARDVVLIDNELDPRTLRAWLRDQGITNTDRVRVVSLRGRTATFDLIDPATRSEWAQAITGTDVVILDCLRPVLDALGLDENKDAGRFLVAFDALLADSGASEALIVHHMGHSGERSRGDSRLQDWPDVTWKIVREDPDNPVSVSYFSAFGRDVNVAESQLEFEPATRHLQLIGGSRKDARVGDKLDDVLAFLENSPGTSKSGIRKTVLGDSTAIGKAVEKGVAEGLIEERPRQGRGGGFVYYLTPLNPSEPVSRCVGR